MKFEISIDAPKIAILPSTEGNTMSRDKKMVLDLGKFVLSNDPERDQGSMNSGLRGDPKYNAFTVNAENLAAYIASDTFDVQARHEILLQHAKENHSQIDFEAYFVLAPLKISLDLQIGRVDLKYSMNSITMQHLWMNKIRELLRKQTSQI